MTPLITLFSIYYDNVLELANGVVFVLAVMMALALVAILLVRLSQTGMWRDRIGQLTIGMITFKVGLATGFGFRWIVARCHSANQNCVPLESESWILLIAVVITTIGGLMIVRILSPLHWRPWSWLGTLMVSLVVPFAYYAFDVMFPTEPQTYGPVLHGSYAVGQVALSVLIAVFGSYVALDVASRARVSEGLTKAGWVTAAAFIMGGSIWAMHFIAMLAYDLPIEVSYDLGMTVFSFLLPVGMTLIGFMSIASAQQREPCVVAIMFAGTLIALGIIGMHYVGIAAMEMRAEITYDLLWVGISVVIAFIGSVVAVTLAFAHTTPLQKLAASAILGVFGISALHYSAMVAFICRATPNTASEAPTILIGMTENQLTVAVSSVTFILLSIFFALSTYDRMKEHRAMLS